LYTESGRRTITLAHIEKDYYRRRKMKRRNGFTLIELLVVIAIIAILAAILFPVFAKAREKARQASCQSNVKQIALGMIQYVQDWDEKYFPACCYYDANLKIGPTGGSRYVYWFMGISPYLKSTKIHTCPSTGNAERLPGDQWTGGDFPLGTGIRLTYSFNAALLGRADASVMTPDDVLMIWDSYCAWCSTQGAHNEIPEPVGYDRMRPWLGLNPDGTPTGLHMDGENYAFADGHVKWMKRFALPPLDPRFQVH